MTLRIFSFRPIYLLALLALTGLGAALFAQVEGERGIAPVASSGNFEVRDVHVDVEGPDAETARQSGWKLAQRLGWRLLAKRSNRAGAPMLSDQALDNLVSGIEVQHEQIGPHRYIATLGVLFDRARAAQILGIAGPISRSPPLLVIPVLTDGGVSTTFERPTVWQKAWATFRTAESAIDYVRATGDGADPVLLNAGQISRRGRNWWRVLLKEYRTADVIMPLARLDRSWPGGPVIGHFSARYGPDDSYIGSFSLRASSPDAVPQMMDEAVKRIDTLYTQALKSGLLKPDPSLVIDEPVDDTALENIGELDAAMAAMPSEEGAGPAAGSISYTVQFDTPTAASINAVQSLVRAIPGIGSANTSSLALGGISVMRVNTSLSPDQLRAALEASGFTVTGSGQSLRIVGREPAGAPPVSGANGQ